MSKVFDRGKTVIPSEVRKALGIGEEEDSIVWILDDKRIYVTSTSGADADMQLMRPHWLDWPSKKDEEEKKEKS